MLHVRSFTRRLLLGPEDAWATRVACTRPAIATLAAAAVALHFLDLLTGIRLMSVYGLNQEQNPLARALFQASGPLGLGVAKLSVVLAGIAVLLYLEQNGRGRLARNCLLVVAMIGLLGFSSNLV